MGKNNVNGRRIEFFFIVAATAESYTRSIDMALPLASQSCAMISDNSIVVNDLESNLSSINNDVEYPIKHK